MIILANLDNNSQTHCKLDQLPLVGFFYKIAFGKTKDISSNNKFFTQNENLLITWFPQFFSTIFLANFSQFQAAEMFLFNLQQIIIINCRFVDSGFMKPSDELIKHFTLGHFEQN